MAERLKFLWNKWTDVDKTVYFFLDILKRQGLLPTTQKQLASKHEPFWRGWLTFVHYLQIWNFSVQCPISIYYIWGDIAATSELVDALKNMKQLGRLHNDRDIQVVEEGRKLNAIALIYFFICSPALVLVGVCVNPVLTMMKREFMVKFWWPIDHRPTPIFEVILLFRLTTEVYGFLLVFLDNALILAILSQVTFQLRLLNANIAKIVSDSPGGRIYQIQSRHRTAEPLSRKRQSFGQSRAQKLEVFEDTEPTLLLKHHSAKRSLRESQERDRESEVTVDDLASDRLPPEQEILGGAQNIGCNTAVVDLSDTASAASPAKLLLGGEERLTHCIQHHQAIIRVVEEFCSTFGLMLLFQLSCVVCPATGTIILILHGQKIDKTTYSFMALMLVAMVQLLLVCVVAEKVADCLNHVLLRN